MSSYVHRIKYEVTDPDIDGTDWRGRGRSREHYTGPQGLYEQSKWIKGGVAATDIETNKFPFFFKTHLIFLVQELYY